MIHPFRRIAHHCWLSLAALIILAAILVSVVRGLFAYANDYRNPLTEWLLGPAAAQLHIGGLSARLVDYHPVLVLNDVRYQSKRAPLYRLHTDSILVGLNLWDSIRQRSFVFQNIQLEGTVLSMPWKQGKSTHDGPSKEFEHPAQQLSEIFLKRFADFQVNDASLNLLMPDDKEQTVFIHSMHWSNQTAIHQGEGDATLPVAGGKSSRIHFIIRLNGDDEHPNVLNMPGEFYASAEHLALSPVGEMVNSPELQKLKTDLNFSLWGKFGANKPALWQLQFQPSSLKWQAKPERSHQLNIGGGQLVLRQHPDYLQLDSDGLKFETDGKDWGNIELQAAFTDAGQQWYLNQLPLARLAPLLDLFPYFEHHSALEVSDGALNALHLAYRYSDHQLQYRGQLNHLVSTASGVIPGFDGLSASVQGDRDGLNFSLGMNDGEIRFDGLFEKNWPVKTLTSHGHVSWQGLPDIRIDTLKFDSPLAQIDAQSRLDWLPGEKLPWLSLYGKVQLSDASVAERFYPHPVMPQNVVDYLKGAIQGGQTKSAKILWYGGLKNYPYREHEGVFQAYVPLKQTKFKFQPDWPPLHDMQLDLLFQNDSLHMQSGKAFLGDAQVANVQAEIAHLNGRSPLTIDAGINKAAAGAVHQYLQQSPIEGLSAAMETLKLHQGTLSGQLALTIPLSKKQGEVAVSGRVDFEQNRFQMPALGLQLDHVTGQLSFRQAELQARNMRGYWKGQPIAFDFSTRQDSDDYQINIDLNGLWNMRQARKALGSPFYLQPVNGQLNWQGNVHVDLGESSQFTYQAQFNSTLNQLSLDLPKPFHKTDQQLWPTRIYVRGDADNGHGYVGIDDRILDRFQYTTKDHFLFQSMRLNIGDPKTLPKLSRELPDSGLAVGVNLPTLTLKPWLDKVMEFTTIEEQGEENSAKISQSASPAAQALAPLSLKTVDATIGQLQAYQQPLNDLKLSYRDVGHIWQADSPALKGQFIEPAVNSVKTPWRFNIQHAALGQFDFEKLSDTLKRLEPKADSPDSQKNNIASAAAETSTLWPAIRVDCQQCVLGRYQLEQLNAWLPFAHGQLKDGYVRARGHGHFKFDSSINYNLPNAKGRTQFAGTFETKDSGKLFESWGLGKSIEQTPLDGKFHFDWHGAPYKLDKSSLNGKLSWKAGEGVLTELSDKGTRLFTLAGLDTIRRRLKLDFRDIFDKGLYFNSAQAKATVKNGVVQNDDFSMDAVAGTIKGDGQADLNTGLIDYHVSFSPKLTSSLPVLTAFAVTPVTGVAVLALSKILEPAIEVITQVDFNITGSLEHPNLIEANRVKKKITIPKELRQQESNQ